jgi:hypothetical protein
MLRPRSYACARHSMALSRSTSTAISTSRRRAYRMAMLESSRRPSFAALSSMRAIASSKSRKRRGWRRHLCPLGIDPLSSLHSWATHSCARTLASTWYRIYKPPCGSISPGKAIPGQRRSSSRQLAR